MASTVPYLHGVDKANLRLHVLRAARNKICCSSRAESPRPRTSRAQPQNLSLRLQCGGRRSGEGLSDHGAGAVDRVDIPPVGGQVEGEPVESEREQVLQ